MESISIKEYCQENSIQRLSNVRENTNGYKYVTFVDANNEAENIYFTKNSSDSVSVGDSPKSLVDAFILPEVTNEAGETRKKITFNNEYQTVGDLFGIVEPKSEVPA